MLLVAHAPKIREGIAALRAELRQTQDAKARYSLGITQLRNRLDAWADDISALGRCPLDDGGCAGLQALIRYRSNKIRSLARAA